MTPQLWWLYLSVTFAADITPGPAVMFVLAAALRNGTKRAVAGIAGILTANTIYFAVSGTAVGTVLARSNLFDYLKWAGAAYLLYLGIRSWLGRAEAGPDEPKPTSHIFRDAFFTQVSNPKALVYFAAILPRFVIPDKPIATQIVWLWIAGTLMEFCVLFTYAIAAGQGLRFARQPRFAVWTNRISGALLIAVGLGLALA